MTCWTVAQIGGAYFKFAGHNLGYIPQLECPGKPQIMMIGARISGSHVVAICSDMGQLQSHVRPSLLNSDFLRLQPMSSKMDLPSETELRVLVDLNRNAGTFLGISAPSSGIRWHWKLRCSNRRSYGPAQGPARSAPFLSASQTSKVSPTPQDTQDS